MAGLTALKVEELDELAATHGVADYPVDGKKDEKVAALAAAGIEGPDEKHRFRLTADVLDRLASGEVREELRHVSFMAGGKAVRLTADEPEYETRDGDVARGLRDLAFLEEVA